MISFRVSGIPKGQPRPRAFSFKGKVRVYDPGSAEREHIERLLKERREQA